MSVVCLTVCLFADFTTVKSTNRNTYLQEISSFNSTSGSKAPTWPTNSLILDRGNSAWQNMCNKILIPLLLITCKRLLNSNKHNFHLDTHAAVTRLNKNVLCYVFCAAFSRIRNLQTNILVGKLMIIMFIPIYVLFRRELTIIGQFSTNLLTLSARACHICISKHFQFILDFQRKGIFFLNHIS